MLTPVKIIPDPKRKKSIPHRIARNLSIFYIVIKMVIIKPLVITGTITYIFTNLLMLLMSFPSFG